MMPVLDLSTVAALAVDLNSAEEALEFLDRFQADLPPRVHAIHAALAARNPKQTATALKSLHTHALTVGALQLHALTGHALTNVDHELLWAGSAPFVTTSRRFLRDLTTEAVLFTHAYRALRSNPMLLDPPRTDSPCARSNPGSGHATRHGG